MQIDWPDIPELWEVFDRYETRWKYCYPGLSIQHEFLRMAEWLEDHPTRWPKKNWKRFCTKWLARNQRNIEQAEAKEMVQRLQARADAGVGRMR